MSREWLEEQHRRYRELLRHKPLVLAGPIVRRCDINAINLFLITNRAVDVIAAAYLFDREGTRGAQLGNTSTSSRKIGDCLHVTLAIILPNAPGLKSKVFPVSTPIGYEISLSFEGADPQPLDQFVESKLAYEPYPTPTIVLEREGTPLLAHASCRKFHGQGYDALARLDDELARDLAPRSNRPRPTALFLTGDQIYADDVPEPLIDTLIVLGEELMGYGERLPQAHRAERSALKASQLRCGMRAQRLQRMFTEAMTSGLVYGRNQLISFGEFAAAYVLAWGDVCWPEELPDTAPCAGVRETQESFDERQKLKPSYREQRQLVERYKRLVPPIRRALANLPTYMIMDDHEVTDDWNISGVWVDTVEHDYLARRVVSNAMAAYWCFQAQGNQPDEFQLTDDFDQYLQILRDGTDFDRTSGAEKADWTFLAPTLPPVLVLNTRTRRDFGKRKKDRSEPPALMSDDAMRRASDLYRSRAQRNTGYPLVVVSPVPVLGPGYVEPVQDFYRKSVRVLQAIGVSKHQATAYEYDPEAWSFNPGAHGRLLYMLQQIGAEACVILSGDVHYGCVLNGVYRASFTADPLRVIQFTSSGSRNASNLALAPLMLGDTVVVTFNGQKGLPNDPPNATLIYAYAGLGNILFNPLNYMRPVPNAIFDRNIGLVFFEPNGTVTCRFLTYNDDRRPGEITIDVPREKPRRGTGTFQP